jgi:hypothetical protein
LRGVVFARTIGVIRFRRRLKRCALAASLLGCYLGGMVTAGIWRPTGDARHQPSTEQMATSQEPPSPVVAAQVPGSAGSAERQVVAAKASCAEVLRRSADRHLFEDGDVKSAVRNYGRLLNLPSAEQQSVMSSRQDNWLLVALKDARSKEMKHDRAKKD